MMKKISTLFAAGLLLATAVQAVETEGVKPGEFTMDLDAAKAYAAENKLPILLDFSGSDWCHWCQLMDSNVFAKAEWKSYATSNVVMVLVDFPQDKSLVPQGYVERNEALQAQFGVEGFPTFVVLDDDGESELGRLTAGEDKTPASFQMELENLFKNRAAVLAAFVAGLSPEDQAKWNATNDKLVAKKAALEKAEAAIAQAEQDIQTLSEEIMTAEGELKEIRVAQLGEEKLKEYKALKAQQEAKMKEFQAWMATSPEQNEENMKTFEKMRSEFMEIAQKLEAF